MTFLPRHPLIQDTMNRHDETSGIAEAGSVVCLVADKKIAKVTASGNIPYAFLGQRVKSPAPGLPQGYQFPGEIGSSDARLGDPVLLFMGGIFETTNYLLSGAVNAGDVLYAKTNDSVNNGKICKLSSAPVALGVDGTPRPVAQAVSALSTDDIAAGKALLIKLLV